MIKGNFNENLTTDLIVKNTTILDPITFESILLKGGYDYEDCCCGGTCTCGCGHNKIELSDKSVISNSINTDSTLVHDMNNVVIENIILEQPDINIPLLALRIGVIFLIGMFIEVFNA
jgi:hypothetical protein